MWLGSTVGLNDWSLYEEEVGLEQRAEMPANMFADPPDTTEAEAALGPRALRHRLPKAFMGAMSLQSANPTARPSWEPQRAAGTGGKGERRSPRAAPSPPPQLGESPAVTFPQP